MKKTHPLLKTAAKRRRESEGIIPSGGFGRQPNVTPVPQIAKRIKARIRERSVPDSVKAALNRREAKMGFGDEIPKRGLGRQPNVTPVLPKIAKRIKARIRERSIPDSAKAALNRREAKMGFGDEIPKWGLGQSPKRSPVLPKIAKRIKARIRERSVPDSVKAALNRREAKMGLGDEIPKRGLGRQSQT